MSVDDGVLLSTAAGQHFGLNRINLFKKMTQVFGVLPPHRQDLPNLKNVGSQTLVYTPQLDLVKEIAETIAMDVVLNFDIAHPKNPRNVYCRTMRRVVKDLSDRHDFVFKGIVNKLKPDEDNFFSTFLIVADEIFQDGHVNWGRIAAVYSFATRIAKHHRNNAACTSSTPFGNQLENTANVLHEERIASFLGKYIANKLGPWILENGGWDAFVEFFPDQRQFEDSMWRGILFTAIGLTALATVVASR